MKHALRLLAVLTLAGASVALAPSAHAVSCNAASHSITLGNGKVSPGTGTTATSFTFSVVYESNAGCAPTRIEVKVNGVGTFSLSAGSGSYASGMTFSRTLTLPVGKRGYSFTVAAGSGPGYEEATLSNVKPAKVTVTAPSPAPTPRPTPRPTPTPTPAPQKTPKPQATPPPTPAVTAAPTPDVQPSAGATASGGTPGPAASPSPRATPRATPGASAAASGRGGIDTPLIIWSLATVMGLALFSVLTRGPAGRAGGSLAQ